MNQNSDNFNPLVSSMVNRYWRSLRGTIWTPQDLRNEALLVCLNVQEKYPDITKEARFGLLKTSIHNHFRNILKREKVVRNLDITYSQGPAETVNAHPAFPELVDFQDSLQTGGIPKDVEEVRGLLVKNLDDPSFDTQKGITKKSLRRFLHRKAGWSHRRIDRFFRVIKDTQEEAINE